jgi:Fe2+ or Zn2+ uptake regulation protein
VLKEMELVEEHRLGEEHSHYEPVRDSPHYHFVCLSCGKVIEFDTHLVAQIEQELIEREGIQVTETHLRLSGYCSHCQIRPGGQRNRDEHERKSEGAVGNRGAVHDDGIG